MCRATAMLAASNICTKACISATMTFFCRQIDKHHTKQFCLFPHFQACNRDGRLFLETLFSFHNPLRSTVRRRARAMHVFNSHAIQQLCKPTENVISSMQLPLIPYGRTIAVSTKEQSLKFSVTVVNKTATNATQLAKCILLHVQLLAPSYARTNKTS